MCSKCPKKNILESSVETISIKIFLHAFCHYVSNRYTLKTNKYLTLFAIHFSAFWAKSLCIFNSATDEEEKRKKEAENDK